MSPFRRYANIEKGLKGRSSLKKHEPNSTKCWEAAEKTDFFGVEVEQHHVAPGPDNTLQMPGQNAVMFEKAMENFFQLLSNPTSGRLNPITAIRSLQLQYTSIRLCSLSFWLTALTSTRVPDQNTLFHFTFLDISTIRGGRLESTEMFAMSTLWREYISHRTLHWLW